VLTQGFRPGAITVRIIGFTGESNIAAAGDFFAETAQIGTEFVVANDAQPAIFEVASEAESEFFFDLRSEGNWFDFPAETLAGAFGKLHAEASGINAGTFELAQFEETIEFEFNFGEGFVLEFNSATIPQDVADFFADVDDAEVVFAGDVEAKIK
jgi:hypothetical protein